MGLGGCIWLENGVNLMPCAVLFFDNRWGNAFSLSPFRKIHFRYTFTSAPYSTYFRLPPSLPLIFFFSPYSFFFFSFLAILRYRSCEIWITGEPDSDEVEVLGMGENGNGGKRGIGKKEGREDETVGFGGGPGE